MADSQYVKDFDALDRILMKAGKAPKAPESQWIGKRAKYELHHMEPINQGGSVYDVSNIMITTPRFHKEVLLREYHYGK